MIVVAVVGLLLKVDEVSLRVDRKVQSSYMSGPRSDRSMPARLFVNAHATDIVVHSDFGIHIVGHDAHGRVAGNLTFAFSGAYSAVLSLGFITTGKAAVAFYPP